MDTWLNMVLLCGLLLIASLQTTDAFRFPKSKREKTNLETNISSLQEQYNGTEGVSKSVFASHLYQLNSKASCTCNSLLLERMLNIYEELFQNMKSEEKEVKNNLKNVMTEVKNLRHQYSEEHKVWRELQEINSVKVKNGTTRGGALNDFLKVFDWAYREKQVQWKIQKSFI
ncbi:interferon gamma-related-like [Megalobrama amblycephala]|uniref:interferon gamma-related-like n=1 Tax=Megalobrama amblycephala TaxID=75352 RepID=UPI002013FCB9|nr:interferon gamma-related-like [Megalobrama amblycephala]